MLRGLDRVLDLTIVEPTGQHQFLTRLAAVAGGVASPADAARPLSDFTDSTILTDRVAEIANGRVVLGSGSSLSADHVILTAGAEPTVPDIPGIENAHTLRTASDALGIRAVASGHHSVVIIGGGAAGCQLAGALASGPFDVFVTLIEASGKLLNGFNPLLGQRAFEILTSRGVSIWTGRSVTGISAEGVQTANGHATGFPVWTGGVRAHANGLIDAPVSPDGRVVVDRFGRVLGFETVFAAGDIAAHPAGGGVHAMSAQVASKAGRGVAVNVMQQLRGEPLSPLELSDLGWVVDLSGGQGVADVIGLPIAMPGLDRLVPFLHDAIDLRNVVQMGGVGHLFSPSEPFDAAANDRIHT